MRRGALWTALGVLLLGTALGLTLRNLRQDRQAGDAAAAVTAQLTRESAARRAARAAETQPAADGAAEAVPDYVRYPGMEMPVTEVDGTSYIGVLTIPALDLALPVQSEWSYPALRRTPCRYSGSAYRDDLILLAHNYESTSGGSSPCRRATRSCSPMRTGTSSPTRCWSWRCCGPRRWRI